MKENPGDLIVNEVKRNAKNLYAFMRKEYKTAKPFHKVPMTKQEQIAQYQWFTPQTEQMMRQKIGDEAVDAYKAKMTSMMTGGDNG